MRELELSRGSARGHLEKQLLHGQNRRIVGRISPVPANDNIPRQVSRIRVLPDRVANQIAAGEVVERPVAVVKELVENSLDAGATHIDVAFEEGGRKSILVRDDGCGMCPDDALTALERHATSKLREAADLDNVGTFGFRGEALPSIASVSRFTMRTRADGFADGVEVFVNNGTLAGTKSVGMPRGTQIVVEHLFESVPARRKFLKSDRTESAHIILTTRLLALAHPDVAFSLAEEGRKVFSSPTCAKLADRAAEVFGREAVADMAEIDAADGNMRLSGLVSKPGAGRAARTDMFWYANKRPVENRILASALVEAAKGFIANGRYPAAFLFLEIDPHAMDVNVHPAKREIRLRDEAGVKRFVIEALVARFENLAREKSGLSMAPAISPALPPKPAIMPAHVARPAPAPATNPKPAPRETPHGYIVPRDPARAPQNAPSAFHTVPVQATEKPAAAQAAPRKNAEELPARWRYLGTAHGNFILFETPDGLLSLNRTAAQTRVLYEDYVESLKGGHLVTQQLLFPRLFELPGIAAAALEKNLPFLRANGFGVENFGANSFRVTSLPAWFEGDACEEFLREVAARIVENGIRPDRDADLARDTLARLAAAHAARSSGPADETEGLALARRLLSCRNPLADPKGNPTYIEFTRKALGGK
jgi:DNA mismatch repair protein MutL